jgi:hypothetical protein
MKYFMVIRDIQRSYGITPSSLASVLDLMEFQDIQGLVANNISLARGVNYADFLDSLLPCTLTLRHACTVNHRASQYYDYHPDEADIATLLSWYLRFTDDETAIIPIRRLQRHFERHSQGAKSFGEFLNQYAGGISRVPIIVRFNNRIIADRLTLLYFILHLHGQYRASGRKEEGRQSIAKIKPDAEEVLGRNLRERLLPHGYMGPEEAVREKFDYEVIKISEAKKRILLAGVGFQEPFSPYVSGRTLLEQELHNLSQGLLAQAERQSERLKYFREEPERFRQYLKPPRDWSQYEIKAYLITKHTPLIDGYGEVRIMSASDFLSSEL